MLRLVVPFAGFALALALRLATLDRREPWLDEALTQFALSLGWADLIADRLAAGHSPAYFLALKAAGFDPAQVLPLRLASTVCDAAACGVLGAAVQRVSGARAALIGMAFYAASPVLIGWAQNARPYALMMLCLAIGLYGAVGLLSADRRRGDAAAFALGLAGAAITLSAGAIAAALVLLAPLLRPGARAWPPAWRRAAWLPLLGIVTMIVAVTAPAVQTQAPTYWTERVASFGPEALAALARGLVMGDRLAAAEAQALLGVIPWQVVTLVAGALIALGIGRALRDLRHRPALLPFAVLALGYPALLLGLSLGTSLLIPRYVLPGLSAALMLAGIGFAQLSRRRHGPALTAAALVAFAALALHHARALGVTRHPVPGQVAAVVLADPAPGTQLFRAPGDWIGFDTMAEVLPHALGPAPNPRVTEAAPPRVRAALGQGPVFLALHEGPWRARYAAALPTPDCLWTFGPAVLAYWGKARADCQQRGLSE